MSRPDSPDDRTVSRAATSGDALGRTHSTSAAPDDTRTAETTSDSVLLPPTSAGELGRLAHFRVLRLLGRGGMGAVYEAEDERLGRRVALKVMLPTVAANPVSRERFTREARAAARVEHDHIIPVYEVGEAGGVPFLAMPLLAGEPLSDRLTGDRPMATAELLRVGREVALGLAAAHAAGLVHRDIKPSNIWIERTADGAYRRARLLDFGLAKVAVAPGAVELTDSGTVMGTPAYMAPEQAAGRPVDFRADLFALGVVLYRLATGNPPFAGDSTFAVLTALATHTPPPVEAVNPTIPPRVARLIDRLLSKTPADRPPSAQAVAEELLAEPPQPPPARRRRWALAALALLLLSGVAVGLAWRLWPTHAPPLAEAPSVPVPPPPAEPAGDWLPARDAFPGEVIAWRTYDDPKDYAGDVFRDTDWSRTVSGGRCVTRYHLAKGEPGGVYVDRPAAEVAFSLRYKAAGVPMTVQFGSRVREGVNTYFQLTVERDGHWRVEQFWVKADSGETAKPSAVRAAATEPVPELSEEKWVALTAWSTAAGGEVWANGVRLAALPGDNEAAAAGGPFAVYVMGGPAAGAEVSYEIDHLLVWMLRPGEAIRWPK